MYGILPGGGVQMDRDEMKQMADMPAENNEDTQRIDAPFDAYAGTRERLDKLQKEMDDLRERMKKLEDLVKSTAS